MNRCIIHIDMNAYFASIEQKCNPFLRGKPIVVTGEGRTVITTSSYEARKFGVKTAMTVPEARKLCPNLLIVIGNPAKYIDTTLRIHNILVELTDKIDAFSIDEFFVDVSDFPDPVAAAQKMKSRIKDEIGITCSVGIAPNKLLAKLASDMKKPDGLTIIKPEQVQDILAKLPIQELCGIGSKMTAHLNNMGVKTAKELGEMPLKRLKDAFGINGMHLKNMGLGIDYAPVHKYWEVEQAKSVGHSHTLPIDAWDLKVVHAYLLMLCEKVSVRLRKAGLVGRTVSLVVRFSDFNTFGKQKTVDSPIKLADEVFQVAQEILKHYYPFRQAVRLVGVSVSNISNDAGQEQLFDANRKKAQLAEALMKINDKYGEFTIKLASILVADHFGIKNRCALIGKYLLKKHA